MRKIMMLFFICIGFSGAAVADCMRDIDGSVVCGTGECAVDQHGKAFCSRFRDGGAYTTYHGEVVCGKGKCAADQYGNVFCSTVVGGGVYFNPDGTVSCYGSCERASASMCMATKAVK